MLKSGFYIGVLKTWIVKICLSVFTASLVISLYKLYLPFCSCCCCWDYLLVTNQSAVSRLPFSVPANFAAFLLYTDNTAWSISFRSLSFYYYSVSPSKLCTKFSSLLDEALALYGPSLSTMQQNLQPSKCWSSECFPTCPKAVFLVSFLVLYEYSIHHNSLCSPSCQNTSFKHV